MTKMRRNDNRPKNMMLSAPGDLPFPFRVIINGVWPQSQSALEFEILSGKNQQTSSGSYRLPQRDHDAYQDFFEKLSFDFGLRKPKNKVPVGEPVSGTDFTVVLTENLAPGIIYGYGDPAVILIRKSDTDDDVRNYLVATSNDAADSFPILRSGNLVNWEHAGYVFPAGHKPV